MDDRGWIHLMGPTEAKGSVPWLWCGLGCRVAGGPLANTAWRRQGIGRRRSVVCPPPPYQEIHRCIGCLSWVGGYCRTFLWRGVWGGGGDFLLQGPNRWSVLPLGARTRVREATITRAGYLVGSWKEQFCLDGNSKGLHSYRC